MNNILLHPSKFWHCFVIIFSVYGIVGVILLGISLNILGWTTLVGSSFLSMLFGLLFGLYIYYKMNGSRWEKSMFFSPVKWYISTIYIILFSVFMIGVYLITPSRYADVRQGPTLITYLSLFVYLWIAAVGEEIMFRGVFYNALKKRYKPWITIIGISLLFGLGHCHYTLHFLSAFVSSIIFSIVYFRTHSLLLCILMHFFGDFSPEILMFFQSEYYHPILGGFVLSVSLFGLFLLDLYVKKNTVLVH